MSKKKRDKHEHREQELIDKAVKFINKNNSNSDQIYTEIGAYVFKEFFGNDPKEASSKKANKQNSYRKLCKDTRLAIKVCKLNRIVRVTVQDDFFQKKGIDVSSLSFSQKAELLPLQKGIKPDIVKKILEHPYSVREIRELVKENQKQHSNNTNPGYKSLKKSLKKMEDSLNKAQIEECADDSALLNAIEPEKRLELKRFAEEASQTAQRKIDACNRLIKIIQEMDNPDSGSKKHENHLKENSDCVDVDTVEHKANPAKLAAAL